VYPYGKYKETKTNTNYINRYYS